MRKDHRFIEDGYDRARSEALPQVRAEVAREYADRLHSAGWLQRLQLQREMQREIEKRLDRVAPPWGLYFSRGA